MTNGDDDFELDIAHLGGDVIQFGFAFRAQDRLVEVKQRVGSQRHLFGGGFRCRCRSSRGCSCGCSHGCRGFLLRHEIRIAFRDGHRRRPIARAPAEAETTSGNDPALVDRIAAKISCVGTFGQGGAAKAEQGGEQ